MPIRIAVWHNLPSGGGKRALHDHVRGLVARGHHVEVWCPTTADRTFLPLADLAVEHVLPIAWDDTQGLSTLGKVRRGRWSTRQKLRAIDEHCRIAARQIDAGGFDVLLAGPDRFVQTPPIGRHVRIPSVLYLQEPCRWLYEAAPRLPWAALPPLRFPLRAGAVFAHLRDRARLPQLRAQVREEAASAAAYNRILVNSYFSRESVLRAYGLSAHVCYLGIDPAHFEAAPWPRERAVIGVGSLTPAKNIHFIVEALAQVSPTPPPLRWVANAVDEAYAAQMRALAEQLGVTLELHINVPEAALIRCLSSATAMVYAPRLEPFGYAPLEANACGLPAVVVAEGGLRETVQDGVNGLVSDPDPTSFAHAVQRLLDDAPLAQRLGERGRALVCERWTLDDAVGRLERHLFAAAGSSAKQEMASA